MSEKKTEGKKRGRTENKRASREEERKQAMLAAWIPKTRLGKLVLNKEINSLNEIEKKGLKIMEPEIVDLLVEDLEEKVVDFKKTTRVTRSGRNFSFRATVIVGDKNEWIGVGVGKDKERWPAIRKATRNAKLQLVRIRKGCGSWECKCGLKHTVPFKVEGSSASVKVRLMPAPKGIGLAASDSIKDILIFAGIKDIWAKTRGNSSTKLNFVQAIVDALSETTKKFASPDLEKKIQKIEGLK
ncbi:MAG: 30S ribosomal protein S5 [archaeon]